MSSIIIAPKAFQAERTLLVTAPALVVEGILQKEEGVTNIKGQRFAALEERVAAAPSHDFH